LKPSFSVFIISRLAHQSASFVALLVTLKGSFMEKGSQDQCTDYILQYALSLLPFSCKQILLFFLFENQYEKIQSNLDFPSYKFTKKQV
jgi:hypothetical protein